MPTYAVSPKLAGGVTPRPPVALQDVELLQSTRGAELQQALGEVRIRWVLVGQWAGLPSDDRIEEPDYVPVPPKQTFRIKARFRLRGRGQPMPYDLDDSE